MSEDNKVESLVKYETFKGMDVDLMYITADDWRHVQYQSTPNLLATLVDIKGVILYIPKSIGILNQAIGDYRRIGFSERFIKLVELANQEGVTYLEISEDGGILDGWDPIES